MAVKEKLTKDSGVAGVHDYDHIVEKLLAKPKAKGKDYLYYSFEGDNRELPREKGIQRELIKSP